MSCESVTTINPLNAASPDSALGGSPFQTPNVSAESSSRNIEDFSQVQPFFRFFARSLDYLLYGSIINLILYLAGIDIERWDILDRVIDIIWSICLTFTWIFIEAYLLSKYGKTLGKHVINTRVVDSSGSLLTYRKALERSFDVWLIGVCMGVLILEWVTMAFWYYKLKHDGITLWDKRGDFRVIHSRFNPTIVYILISIYGLALLYYGLRALSAYLEISKY